jgi:hypothetical protein
MAQISFNADVKIKVVFPYVTKSLKTGDKSRVEATGAFTYTPKPQIDTARRNITESNFQEATSNKDRAERLKAGLSDLLSEIAKIKAVMAKRAKNIFFQYDPMLTSNEAYADAEETLFGFASGTITFDMYQAVLDFEEKIDKWIAHKSIANGGNLGGA